MTEQKTRKNTVIFFWKRRTNKQKLLIVASGFAALILGYCTLGGGGLPANALDVSLAKNQYGFLGDTVHITSRVDQITINNVVFNRGKCDLDSTYSPLPQTLSFGESTDERPNEYSCNVIEVIISTNQGVGDYEFDSQ